MIWNDRQRISNEGKLSRFNFAKYSGIGSGGKRLVIKSGVMLLETKHEKPSATGLLTPRISSIEYSYS